MIRYAYRAAVVRVIDGDTVILDLDLGFYVTVRMSCRLLGINAIELHAPGGREARDYLVSLLPVGVTVDVVSVKPDKYAGRFDGIVLAFGVDVGVAMVAAGFALPWDGLGARPVPTWPPVVTAPVVAG